ncbi:Nnp-1 [Trypoxylus dichotomus]
MEESSMAVKKPQRIQMTRESMTEKSKSSKAIDKKTFVIAQEIKLAKVLAGNNKTLRDRVLKRLKRWFEFRSKSTPFTEDDFMRIWKGLFYAMWMSDKPLFQEECAEKIASLVHLNTVDYSLMFFKCGLRTLGNDWFGIDQLRLDKFLMLVRRLLRQGFVILKKNEWNLKIIKDFNNILSATILNVANPPPSGFVMHFTEVYLEELAKISEGKLRPNLLTEFVSPFIKQLALLDDCRQIKCIEKSIFHHLMEQSDLGLEYEEKFKAWKKQGFPGGSIDAMQREELSIDEEMLNEGEDSQNNEAKQKVLDPRAGHVDVVLPQLKFIPKQIIEILNQSRFVNGSNSLSRKAITTAINEFTRFSRGDYPLGLKKIDKIGKAGYSTKIKQAANRLVKFEKKLLNKDNKKRKRKNNDKIDEKDIRCKKIISKLDNGGPSRDLDEFIKKSEGNLAIDNKRHKMKEKNRPLDNVDRKKLKKKQKIILNGNANTKLSREQKVNVDNRTKPLTKGVKKKRRLHESVEKNYECTFERNSGTWFVYDDDSLSTSSIMDLSESKPPTDISVDLIVTNASDIECMKPKKLNGDLNGETKTKSEQKEDEEPPRKRIAPIMIVTDAETPAFTTSSPKQSPKKSTIFKANEWEEEKDETKTVALMKNYQDFVDLQKWHTLNSLSKSGQATPSKMQKRRSLDSQVIKNPFAKPVATPGSSKKVKIALNLNKAQDIHEHVAQIKSSPGIPFDANKKPAKPLLKRHTMSPIDPFYKRKIYL